MMAIEDTESIRLNEARNLTAKETLYVNANYAVWSVETDCGGLEPEDVWHETEWLREELLRTNRVHREDMVVALYQSLVKKYRGKVENVSRTVMCIMLLFADRLVVASRDQQKNPNREVIRSIVKVLAGKMKDDEGLMKPMVKMLARIDSDGTANEEKGRKIPWGLDVLADDVDWNEQLKAVLDTYADKADSILDSKMADAFDAIWEELVADSQFSSEMRVSTLDKNYNLKLIFAVYGLMLDSGGYTSKVRGAQSIARVVGLNPTFKNKENHYSKDYFNPNEIEKLSQGIKSQQLLNLVKRTIKKHTSL